MSFLFAFPAIFFLILEVPESIDNQVNDPVCIKAIDLLVEYETSSIHSFTFKRNSVIKLQPSIARVTLLSAPKDGHCMVLNGCKFRISDYQHEYSSYFIDEVASLSQPKMDALAAEMSVAEQDTLFLRLIVRFLTMAFSEVSKESLVFQGELTNAIYLYGGKPPRDPFACSDTSRKGIVLVTLPSEDKTEFMFFVTEPLVPITNFTAETFIIAGILEPS